MEHKENLCKSGQTDSLSLCTNQAQVTSLAEIVKEDYPLSIIRAKNEQGVETLAAHIVSKINYYLKRKMLMLFNDKLCAQQHLCLVH